MKKKNNKAVRKELEILYGCKDMLTLLQSNKLTYHHILKKSHGGNNTLENGALLERLTHDWLHSLEYTDKDLYNLINECLCLFKQCIDLNEEELINQYVNEVAPKVLELVRNK